MWRVKSSAALPISDYACIVVNAANTIQRSLGFGHSDGFRHFRNRQTGIVRPEDAAVLIFVIAKPDLIPVSGAHRFAVLQLRVPRQDGIAEIHLMNKRAPRREYLC